MSTPFDICKIAHCWHRVLLAEKDGERFEITRCCRRECKSEQLATTRIEARK